MKRIALIRKKMPLAARPAPGAPPSGQQKPAAAMCGRDARCHLLFPESLVPSPFQGSLFVSDPSRGFAKSAHPRLFSVAPPGLKALSDGGAPENSPGRACEPGGIFRNVRRALKERRKKSAYEKTNDIGRDACARGAALAAGFTLLEVLVSLTVLAVGAALTLSLISGSLGNIRKVQLKTRTVEHAEAVMELALLDNSIRQPTTLAGDFEDGTRWSVRIEDYELAGDLKPDPRALPQNMPVKLLCYTVEVFSPESGSSDYRLQTLKLVRKPRVDR